MSDTPATAPAVPEWLVRLVRNRNALIGGIMIAIVFGVALFAPWISPYDANKVSILKAWQGPSAAHLLGTDALGRDVVSRLMAGAQTSMLVALTVLSITLAIGTITGMCAAWYRGLIDGLLMRGVDIVFAFPEVIIAILVAAVMGPGLVTIIVTMSLVWWPGIARLARSLVLGVREELFIEAAVASGTPVWRIMLRHFLPNIAPGLMVRASLGVGLIIMAEAGLSFLGIGIQEPNASWGGMIRDGLPNLRTDPHLALAASSALTFTMIGFNLLGDGLRDVLDPKRQQ